MSALTQITAEAKRIRKKSPGKKWMTCVKEASAKYRGKKRVSGTARVSKKSAVRKVKATRRRATVARVGNVRASVAGIGTLAQNIARAKSLLLGEISNLQARKMVASTKRGKKELQKKISLKLTVYRRLVSH